MQDARFCSEFVTVQDEGYAAFMASELNNAFMARCRQRSLGHGTGRWWAQHARLVSRSWCRCLRSILRLLICFARLCRRCKLLRWTSLFCRHLGFPFRQRLLVLLQWNPLCQRLVLQWNPLCQVLQWNPLCQRLVLQWNPLCQRLLQWNPFCQICWRMAMAMTMRRRRSGTMSCTVFSLRMQRRVQPQKRRTVAGPRVP